MNRSFLTTILVLLTILYSCDSNHKEIKESVIASEAEVGTVNFMPPEIKKDEEISDALESNNSEPETVNNNTPVNKKKIIKDGNISVKTNDITFGKKNIDELLKNLNAYYEAEDLQNNDQLISYNLKVRVPAENFEKLISGLENSNGEVKSKNIQARDVTEEFVDIETRLKNKREYLKRYMALLAKAYTVKDILTIEENIRTLEEEIESKEGRLKYLNDQVSFSTLNINLYQEKEFIYKAEQEDKFSERVKKALSNGWTGAMDIVLWSISVWPLIVGIIGIVVLVRRVRKRKSGE